MSRCVLVVVMVVLGSLRGRARDGRRAEGWGRAATVAACVAAVVKEQEGHESDQDGGRRNLRPPPFPTPGRVPRASLQPDSRARTHGVHAHMRACAPEIARSRVRTTPSAARHSSAAKRWAATGACGIQLQAPPGPYSPKARVCGYPGIQPVGLSQATPAGRTCTNAGAFACRLIVRACARACARVYVRARVSECGCV